VALSVQTPAYTAGHAIYSAEQNGWLDSERIQREAVKYYINTFRFSDKEYQDFNVNERFGGDLHALQRQHQFYQG
jgi:hypothetical protein